MFCEFRTVGRRISQARRLEVIHYLINGFGFGSHNVSEDE